LQQKVTMRLYSIEGSFSWMRRCEEKWLLL
jgi:hypothetical protein